MTAKNPTTVWGTLTRAAALVDQLAPDREGSRAIRRQPDGAICPDLAIQHLLWPKGNPPRTADGAITEDAFTETAYWATIAALRAAVIPATLPKWTTLHGTTHARVAELLRTTAATASPRTSTKTRTT